MTEHVVVLIVEDEPLLRMSAIDMVENAGFAAIEAANSTEAVAVLEKRPDIRVILTDVEMPRGIDGMKLAALVRKRWPPVEIIIVSGHVDPVRTDLPERCLFFPKPYREEQIVDAIRKFAA